MTQPLEYARYQRMRKAGFTDEDIQADGFEIPAPPSAPAPVRSALTGRTTEELSGDAEGSAWGLAQAGPVRTDRYNNDATRLLGKGAKAVAAFGAKAASGASVGTANLIPPIRELNQETDRRMQSLRDRGGAGKVLGLGGAAAELTAGVMSAGQLAKLGTRAAAAVPGTGKVAGAARGAINAATGNLPTTILPKGSGAWKQAANSLKNIRNTATTGAAQGAIYGASTGDNALEGAAQGAGFGAMVGGGVSGLIEASKAGRELLRVIASRIPGVDTQAAQRAYDDLAEMAVSENLTPEQFMQRVRELPEGDLVVDALQGNLTRGRVLGALDDTSQRGVRQAGEGLKADVGRRAVEAGTVRDAFLETAGVNPSIPPAKQRAEIRADTRAKAGEKYEQLYEAFPDEIDDPALTALMSERGKDGAHLPALAKAEEIAERRLRALRERGPASFTPRNTPIRNIQFYDEVKKVLGEMGQGGDIMARQLEKEIVARLDEITAGKFAETRAVVQEGRTREAASKLGERGATSSDPRTQDFLVEQELSKRGVTPDMAQRVRGTNKEAKLMRVAGMDEAQIRKMLRSGKNQQFLQNAMDDYPAFEARAKDILRKEAIAAELQHGKAFAAPGGGRLLDADVFGALTPWDIASAMRGNPTLAIAHVAASAEGKFIKGRNARTNGEILKLARSPARSQSKAFEAITKAMTDKLSRQSPRTSTRIPRGAGVAARLFSRQPDDE